jgi:transglutaminase-like putative cysteine protease
MNLHVSHRSEYAYEPKAARVSLRIKLFPSQFEGQYVRSWSVAVNGEPVTPIYVSGYGDDVALWQSDDGISNVVVSAEGVVETEDMNGVVRDLPRRPPRGVFLRKTRLTDPSEAILELARDSVGDDVLSTCHSLCDAVNEKIAYRSRSTHAATTAAEAFEGGTGVCQDHAHIMIAACRSLDIPSRYVTGYMMAGEGEDDVLETHAWAEVFVQELGWVGFDPSNALCPTDRYIRLACGLDADDAAPIKGHVVGETDISLSAQVAVVPNGGQQQSQ